MDIQEETILVVRLTRLEAARTLVAPNNFQTLLRARLSTMTEREAEPIEGEPAAAVPALTAGGNCDKTKVDAERPSPTVQKAMRKFNQAIKRTACPHGCGKFKRLGVHMAKTHKADNPTSLYFIKGEGDERQAE